MPPRDLSSRLLLRACVLAALLLTPVAASANLIVFEASGGIGGNHYLVEVFCEKTPFFLCVTFDTISPGISSPALPWSDSQEAFFGDDIATTHSLLSQSSFAEPLRFGGTGEAAADTTSTPSTSLPWGVGIVGASSSLNVVFKVVGRRYQYDIAALLAADESGAEGEACARVQLSTLRSVSIAGDSVCRTDSADNSVFAASGVLDPGFYAFQLSAGVALGRFLPDDPHQTFDLAHSGVASWDGSLTLAPVGPRIPEPTTLTLIGITLASVFARRVRRAHSRQR